MKVGVLVESEEGLDWTRWRRLCAAVEDLGFDSLWLSDHFSSPWTPERHGIEPWTALSVAAATTRELQLGPLVSPITFRPAAVLARMAESLAALSGGRFVLGLGLGWNAAEHAAVGLPFPSFAARRRAMQKALDQIEVMQPSPRVPILLGGGGDATLELAARAADEWNLTTGDPVRYRARAAALDAWCATVGRPPRAVRRSLASGVLVGRDPAELAARAQRLQTQVPPLRRPAGTDLSEVARTELGWLVGTPADLVVRLRTFAGLGVDRVMLGHYDLDDMSALELLASDVLPALR